MNDAKLSVRAALYEAPGPRTKRRIVSATALSMLALAALLTAVLHRFYVTGQLGARYWTLFTRFSTWRFLGQGLAGTLKVALVSSALAFGFGMALMLLRLSAARLTRLLGTVLIELSRGIPTLLFIYFFFLVAPQFGLKLPSFWKIALPVSLSAAGVVAEVLRSGVNAVPAGQTEAALSLGMRRAAVFFRIVFPQGLRFMVPSLIAELVIVLKDTTFAYVVSYADLMQNARVLISNHDALLSVYLVVAVIYILINYRLNRLSVFAAAHSGTAGAARI